MELLTTRQLAKAAGVSDSSIKRWVDRGRIAATRTPGGHRRIALPDALKFMREEGLMVDALLADAGLGSMRTQVESWKNLRDALVRADLRRTQEILIGSWLAGRPMAQIWDELVTPAMKDIGNLWEEGPEGIATEHIATDLVAQVASQLRTMVEAGPKPQPLAVGCAPELDPYLLPSLAVSTVLGEAGWHTSNLGPMTPIAALLDFIESQAPSLVWVCFSRALRRDEIDQLVEQVLRTSNSALVVGGRGIPADWKSGEARCIRGRNMAALAALLEELEPSSPAQRARKVVEQ